MPLKWQEKPLPSLAEGERHSVFAITNKFFPTTFLIKAIGVSFTSFLFIYRYLDIQGIGTFVTRVLLTLAVVAGSPTIILYLFTLLRAPAMRRREEAEAVLRKQVAHGNRKTQQAKEQKEEQELLRLQEVASSDLEALGVKNKQEDTRWDVLNEKLRVQDEIADGRSSAVLHNKEIKDEEDAQQREDVAAAVAGLLRTRDEKDDERWKLLNERFDRLEAQNDRRDERQRAIDDFHEIRLEGELRYQYDILHERFQRHAASGVSNQALEDQPMPIPDAWLKKQPEVARSPTLLERMRKLNER